MVSRFVHEQPPRLVDTYVVLDMDGTLLRSHALTPLIVGYFLRDAAHQQHAVEAITRQKGNDFDSFTYLASESGIDISQLDTEALASGLIERFGHEELREQLLLPGADTVSYELRRRQIPHGILTKGGTVFQNFKLSLLRQLIDEPHLPALITTTDAKSRHIEQSWWNEEQGIFEIPAEMTHGRSIHARHIIVIDDKETHLASSHDRISGYHIDTETVEDFIVDLHEGKVVLK